MYLSEQKLAEDNRQKILQLQDRQLQESRQQIEAYFRDVAASRESAASLFTSIGENFFNPANFTSDSPDRLCKALYQTERVDELKKLIAASKEAESRAFEARNNAVNNNALIDILGKTDEVYNQAVAQTGEYVNELDRLQKSGRGAYVTLEGIAKSIAGGNVRGFDEAAKAVLKYRQELERASVASEIGFLTGELGKDKNNSELQYRLKEANRNEKFWTSSKRRKVPNNIRIRSKACRRRFEHRRLAI